MDPAPSTGGGSHTCQTCGKGFASIGILNKHTKTHQAAKEQLCGVCGKNFKSVASFRKHAKTHEGLGATAGGLVTTGQPGTSVGISHPVVKDATDQLVVTSQADPQALEGPAPNFVMYQVFQGSH